MEIHLQEMRKRTGLKQAEIAKRLDVKVLTHGPWESGGAMMSLEQVYNCAVFLDCSIDEIAGMSQDVAERDLPTAEGAR